MHPNNIHKNSFSRPMQHVVLIGACSLVLSAGPISSSVFGSSSPRDSYAQSNALQMHNSMQIGRPSKHQVEQQRLPVYQPQEQLVRPSASFTGYNVAEDSSSLATSSGTGLTPASRPSVYHSIIDRPSGPSRRQASPAIQTSTATTSGDLHAAAGHHHGHAYGKYYEYRAVPKKKTWKFGYRRGNHKHTIARHEHGKAGKHPQFKTKVKWHDKKSKGKGVHLWDYNHHDKKHYHHG